MSDDLELRSYRFESMVRSASRFRAPKGTIDPLQQGAASFRYQSIPFAMDEREVDTEFAKRFVSLGFLALPVIEHMKSLMIGGVVAGTIGGIVTHEATIATSAVANAATNTSTDYGLALSALGGAAAGIVAAPLTVATLMTWMRATSYINQGIVCRRNTQLIAELPMHEVAFKNTVRRTSALRLPDGSQRSERDMEDILALKEYVENPIPAYTENLTDAQVEIYRQAKKQSPGGIYELVTDRKPQ